MSLRLASGSRSIVSVSITRWRRARCVSTTGVSAVTDKGDVILGRAGSFFTGFSGGIWIEGLGWMSMTEFLHKQGVVEADDVPYNNPLAVSASGSEIVGGIAGAQFSWMIEADQVYVCENGQSVLTGFPGGLRAKVAAGAEFGRCEFLD